MNPRLPRKAGKLRICTSGRLSSGFRSVELARSVSFFKFLVGECSLLMFFYKNCKPGEADGR
jgi:hypothetical protein